MTKTKEKLGDEMFKLYREIVELQKATRTARSALMSRLWRIRKEKLFKNFDMKSFNAFVAQPEIAIRPSTAYLLTNLYDYFVKQKGLSEKELEQYDQQKLNMIRQLDLTAKKELEEWLSKSENLSRSDFQVEIDEALGRKKKSCDHEWSILRCSKCLRSKNIEEK